MVDDEESGPKMWSRRDVLVGLSTLLAASGCAGAAPQGETMGQQVRVTSATYLPESYDDLFPPMLRFMETVRQRSEGRVKFDWYPSETLLSAAELMPGLIQGNADIIFITSSYVSASYPLLSALELPFTTNRLVHIENVMDVGSELYRMINSQLTARGLRLLGTLPASFQYIWTASNPIRKPEHLRGLRIRVPGHMEALTLQTLGAAPTSMSSAEVFEALERGIIDGLMSYPGTIIGRSLQEVVNHGTIGPFGHYSLAIFVRSDWWDGLSPAVQSSLLAAAQKYHTDGTAHLLRTHEQKYFPQIERAGVDIIELAQHEVEEFRAALQPVYDTWRGSVNSASAAERALRLVQGPIV